MTRAAAVLLAVAVLCGFGRSAGLSASAVLRRTAEAFGEGWSASRSTAALKGPRYVSQEAAGASSTISAAGSQFQIDGAPAWLLGVSLFDALGPVPSRDADLDALRDAGVRIVRVWAHWREPIYAPDGSLTAQGSGRLRALLGRLRARGLLLELVLFRPGQFPGQPYALFTSASARGAAVAAVTTALVNDRDVIFDLYNEHDHGDGPISHAELRVLRDSVKAIDPRRVVTVSSTEQHLMDGSGRIGEEQARNLREEVGRGAGQVGVDVLAVHLPRTADWASQTGQRVELLKGALGRLDSRLPIYLNEPRRAAPDRVVPAADYARAAAGAKAAGAAGWVFHTAAGYNLAAKPFLAALTEEERAGLSAAGAHSR